MRQFLPAWLAGLAIAGSSFLEGQPAFLRKDILLAPPPQFVIYADLNGDAQPDLVVSFADGWLTAINDGEGSFTQVIRHPEGLYGAVVGDFNGDGRDDLVAAVSTALLLSNGDGTFLRPQIVSSGDALAAADFNRDGRMDLLVTTNGAGAQVLPGNGDGTFQPGATITDERVAYAEVADFNVDGRNDVALLVATEEYGSPTSPLLIFLGNGDGSFGPESRMTIEHWRLGGGPGGTDDLGVRLTPFLIADFDGDSRPDLAVNERILLAQGDGSFVDGPPYPDAIDDWGMYPIAAADFDADGNADLAARNLEGSPNLVWIFPGGSDGALGEPFTQPVGLAFPGVPWVVEPPHAYRRAVDLNADGRLDLVVANMDSNSLSILLGAEPGAPQLRRAVSSADMHAAVVAPGSLATLFVPTGVASNLSASPPWPHQLGNVELVLLDRLGGTAAIPLLFVSPNQINFQVPEGIELGEARLFLGEPSEETEIGGMDVAAVAPRLFYTEWGPAATAVRIEPDGTQTPLPLINCTGPEADPCSAWDVAAIPLSTAAGRPIYLSLYGTGFSGANENNITCSSDAATSGSLPVVYAGPQEIPGVDQINILLRREDFPEDFINPEWPLVSFSLLIEMNGTPANTVTFLAE